MTIFNDGFGYFQTASYIFILKKDSHDDDGYEL